MDTGSLLPAFLLLAPIILAVVDLLGIGSGHSSMGNESVGAPILP